MKDRRLEPDQAHQAQHAQPEEELMIINEMRSFNLQIIKTRIPDALRYFDAKLLLQNLRRCPPEHAKSNFSF